MQRFKYWVILLVSSAMYFVSVLDAISFWQERVDDGYQISTAATTNREYYERWTVSTAIVTVVLSLGGTLCCLLPQRKLIQRIEVLLIFAVVALNGVIATYATIKPSYKLSLDNYFLVVLPNVFLFGWLTVFGGILLLANWYWHDIQKEGGLATVRWILLGSSSFVVMISALAYRDASYDTVESYLGNQTAAFGSQIESGTSICELNEEVDCVRVGFALVLGAISAAASTSVAAWKNAPKLCQSEVSFLLLVAWIAGVALLTFKTGPGKIIGNIYFGTWMSLFISLDIFIATIKAAQEDTTSGGAIVEERANTAVDRDDFFGVAHDQLEIQVAGWSSGRRGSDSTHRIRKGSSSVMFSSIGEWHSPSKSVDANGTLSHDTAPDASQTSQKIVQAKQHKLTRLEFWILLLLLSCVCLSALYSNLPGKGDREKFEVFALAAPSASIGLSFCGYIACLMPHKVARYAELVLGFAEALVWSAGLRFLSMTKGQEVFTYHLDNGDIIRYERREENSSNVMLSAWGALVMSLLLITSWWKASCTVTDWVLLAAFSFALMVSSHFDYKEEIPVENSDGSYTSTRVCTTLSDYSCIRTLLGQYLGMASGIVSLVMIPMTKIPVVVHVVVSTLLFIAWAVGVSLIAYGSGHGTSAGDVFLEVWACVFLSLDIATTNIALRVRMKEQVNKAAIGMGDNAITSSKVDEAPTLISQPAENEPDTGAIGSAHSSDSIPEIEEGPPEAMHL